MTQDRLPWLRFYPQDFMGDGKVQMMNATERGIYISLLCHEWSEGPIPDDPERMARVCGTDPGTMAEAWPQVRPCFNETKAGRLVQPRLEEEREKALEKREQARRAARARWDDSDAHAHAGAGANADATQPQSERNADAPAVADATSDANQNHNQKQQQKGTAEESGRSAAEGADATDASADELRVWDHYIGRYGERYESKRANRLKLQAAGRLGKIRARMREGYSVNELCTAIDGNFGDDWYRDHDQHELELILRNQSKVEDFLNRAAQTGGSEDRGGGVGGDPISSRADALAGLYGDKEDHNGG